MRIAINGRMLIHNKLEGIGYFTWEVLKKMVSLYPGHDYMVLFDRKPDEKFLIPGVEFRVIRPAARHPALYRIWFDMMVPWQLKLWDAEIFLSFDGFTSQYLHIPSITGIHDLAYLHFPAYMKSSDLKYYQKYQPIFARLSARILTVSSYSAKDIANQYNIEDQKIEVVFNGSRFEQSKPPDDPAIPEKYGLASGHYFIYTGSLHPRKNIIRLIKAYEQTEAATTHGVKLVLAGREAWETGRILDYIDQSPFSDQIVLTGYISDSELWNLLKYSCCLCYVSLFEGFGVPLLDGFHAEVPVICSGTTSLAEVAGDSALLVDPENVQSISRAMDTMYSDMALRQHFIHNGIERRSRFSWASTTQKIFRVIEEVYNDDW